MAEYYRYCDTDVVGGLGDGTSWANAYSALDTLRSSEATDLVSAGNNLVVYVRASSGSTDGRVYWTGFTTDATHDVQIIVGTSDRHDGTRSSGYVISDNSGFAGFVFSDPYITIFGLAITNAGGAGIDMGDNNCVVDSCLIYDTSTNGIYIDGSTNLVANTIIYSAGSNGIDIDINTTFYNLTIMNSTSHGINIGDFRTATMKNCYIGGSGGTDYNLEGGNSVLTSTTCHDSDGSADTTTALSVGAGGYFTNVTSSTEDLHITSSSSGLYQTGTDLSGEAYPITVDFENDARDASNPCVGADEYIIVGGAVPFGGIYGKALSGSLGGRGVS